jgi:hypothetical protein
MSPDSFFYRREREKRLRQQVADLRSLATFVERHRRFNDERNAPPAAHVLERYF